VTAWTQCVDVHPFAERRLVCFPHAGGSPYFFREWGKALPALEVHAVCYPGRAERFKEPLATDVVHLAGEIAEALRPLLDRPVALFGHSMGAVVAYETARRLQAVGAPVSHLYVSGAAAAHLPRAAPAALDFDDEAVVRTLIELGGTDAELLDNPQFRGLVLPYIASDFRMLASYTHRSAALLDCPVTALLGRSDPRVTPDQSAAWGQLGSGGFRHEILPGGHFYLAAEPPFALIEETCGGRGRRTAPPPDGRPDVRTATDNGLGS
jgi:surfactin synthase thioesterase subunit